MVTESMRRQANLTRAERARMSYLINTLADMSKDGWANATMADYGPLERELDTLMARKRGH